MEKALGCSSKQTATEQKEAFTAIIREALGDDEKKSEGLFMEIQETLNNIVEEHNTINGKDAEPIILTNDSIQDILIESGLSEEITAKIEKSYTEEFGDAPPVVEHLIDKKVLAANEQRKKEEKLHKKIQILEEILEETKQENAVDTEKEAAIEAVTDELLETVSSELLEETTDSASEVEAAPIGENYDIVLKVKPEKVPQIRSEIIEGKKCIIIPVEDNEQANVNGITAEL